MDTLHDRLRTWLSKPLVDAVRTRRSRMTRRGRMRRAATALGGRRFALVMGGVVGLLATVNLVMRFGPAHSGLVLAPTAAVALVVLARRHGLSWHDLGLAPRSMGAGAAYAVAAIVLVGAVYLAGAALPATRALFVDVRYQLPLGAALTNALVVIPLGTVLLEEIAFRGVLLGLVGHRHGFGWATFCSSVLFGLWHILPSLRWGEANQAAHDLFGAGPGGRVGAVVFVVGFTAVAGLLLCELRRRSGSLLASAGLHWATNGVGVLVTAALWGFAHP